MAAKTLPSQEFLRECFTYDPVTGVVRWRERPAGHFFNARAHKIWNTQNSGNVAGILSNGYRYVTLNGKMWLMHRIIVKIVTNKEPPEVDHRNCVRADNAWGNLREATRLTNSKNHPGKSGCQETKGIRFHKGAWTARICAAGIRRHLGSFKTKNEALNAYAKAANSLHGEFANYRNHSHHI